MNKQQIEEYDPNFSFMYDPGYGLLPEYSLYIFVYNYDKEYKDKILNIVTDKMYGVFGDSLKCFEIFMIQATEESYMINPSDNIYSLEFKNNELIFKEELVDFQKFGRALKYYLFLDRNKEKIKQMMKNNEGVKL